MPSPLTDLKIRKAKPGTWVSDPHHRGLRLYKGDGGLGVFWYRYRSLTRLDAKGKPMLDTVRLGLYSDSGGPHVMSLTEARSKWREMKLLRKAGTDPKGHNTPNKAYTCKELVNDYITDYARNLKRGWRNDERILNKDVISRLGDQPATLSRNEAKALLAEVAQRGDEAAMKLLAICRKAWNHAIEEEKLSVNPFARLKVVRGVVMASDTPVDKVERSTGYWDDLSLQKFFRWLPESGLHLQAQRIAILQLLTGARPGEVVGMPWSEVDFERRVWTIPPARHKKKKEHLVMLSDQGIDLLKSQRKVSGGGYVFHAILDVDRVCQKNWYNHAWKKALEKSSVEYVTPHGLRHTVITSLAKLRCPQEVTKRIAGHSSKGVTEKVYNHHERDQEAREWLQTWADHIDALQVDNVAALAR